MGTARPSACPHPRSTLPTSREDSPFAFKNAHGDLVGFDIELAHRLAADLGVTLELVPVTRATLTQVIASGQHEGRRGS